MHPQRIHPALIARQRREPCPFCGRDLAGKVGRTETLAGPVCWPSCPPGADVDLEPRLPLEGPRGPVTVACTSCRGLYPPADLVKVGHHLLCDVCLYDDPLTYDDPDREEPADALDLR